MFTKYWLASDPGWLHYWSVVSNNTKVASLPIKVTPQEKECQIIIIDNWVNVLNWSWAMKLLSWYVKFNQTVCSLVHVCPLAPYHYHSVVNHSHLSFVNHEFLSPYKTIHTACIDSYLKRCLKQHHCLVNSFHILWSVYSFFPSQVTMHMWET